MTSQKWFIAAIGGVALVAIVALVLALFALRPFGWNNPGYGFVRGGAPGPMFDNGFGPGLGPGRGPMMGRDFGGPRQGRGFAGPMMMGWAGPENSLLATVAETLELDQSEVLDQVRDGKTLAEVITENNGSVEAVIDAFVAPRLEHLNELVAAEELTQEEADAMTTLMRGHVSRALEGEGLPSGFGRGGLMGGWVK